MTTLRADIAAAVSVSAGVLVAAGYFLTSARLANLGVPPGPVMAALPRGYYIGEAVHSILLPFVMSLTLGATWVVGVTRWVPGNQLPGGRWWTLLALGVGVYAWIAATLPNQVTSLGEHTAGGYLPVLALTLIVLMGASVFLGYLGRKRLEGLKERTSLDRFKINASITLVICVLGASAFRIVDARFIPDPFPAAAIYTERVDCVPVSAAKRSLPGCPVTGYYFGESEGWLYLIQKPDPRIPAYCDLRDRLLLIPKGDIRGSAIARNFASLPKPPSPPIQPRRAQWRSHVALCRVLEGPARLSLEALGTPIGTAKGAVSAEPGE